MLQKIGHIILAILLFIGSTGLVINKHYCQDELKSMAVFQKAKSCHAAKQTSACPMHAQQEQDDDQSGGCCDDQSEMVKVEQEQTFPVLGMELQLSIAMLPPSAMAFDLSSLPSIHLLPEYLHYKPPPLVCDLPVLLQTFRC